MDRCIPRSAKNVAIRLFHLSSDDSDDSDDELRGDMMSDDNAQEDELSDDDVSDGDAADHSDDDSVITNASVESINESNDESVDDVANPKAASLISSSGISWKTDNISCVGRFPARNMFRLTPGVKRAILPTNERNCLLLFFDEIIYMTVRYTNLHGKRTVRDFNHQITQPHKLKKWTDVSRSEMEAFFGLLILSGAYKGQFRSTEELWSPVHGQPVFRATLSEERFIIIKKHLRTDDTRRRDDGDKLAPVREVFMKFLSKLNEFVVAGPNLVVDEQLLEFHGRVSFKQYIGSKPGKFGMKIFWLCDTKTTFCHNGIIYIGANTLDPEEQRQYDSLSEAIVMHLMKPFLNEGRNLTADNWFSSLSLVQNLLTKNTTYVGTIRKNKREIPPAARLVQNRRRGDTHFYHFDDIVLISFWDKGSTPVLLIDSFSRDMTIPNENNKPSAVLFYNQTKSGVDNLDKMVRTFSTKRKCRRWPFAILMNLLDVAIINSGFIWNSHTGTVYNKQHCDFMKNVGYQLVDGQIKARIAKGGMKETVSHAMKLLGYTVMEQHCEPFHMVHLPKQKRCKLCGADRDRKTKTACAKCGAPMCLEHRAYVCNTCFAPTMNIQQ